ncbi:hypothetical protein MZM54_00100 [[Brevibacterium] frigoritolerans]|nr:hypothetical protein [Peribacillus frigoritolerans]
MERNSNLLSLKEIDAVENSKEKLKLWISYGKAFNCLDQMPEVHELYTRLKREKQITLPEWNQWINLE